MSKIDVARCVYLAMTKLGMSRKEALYLTPVEFDTLFREYLKDHGVKTEKKGSSIDDLP